MYAVVVFTKESSDTFKSVQEIPVSWLSEDRKFCRWPPKNSCIYTANNVQPQDDWPWHPVEVEIICDSLKEAQKRSKKEVSTDEEQLGKGFRAPKPKDYYSPDTSVPRRRMDKDQYEFPPTLESMNNCVAPVTVERMNSFLPGEHYVNTVISNRQNHIDIVEPTNLESVNSEETLLTELGVLSDADEISSSGRSAAKIDRLEEKFDKIIEILSEHKLMLEELMGQCQKEKSSLEPFAFDLPLGNLEDIMSLEGKLADKTFLALFVKDLENVGGNGPKDFVCRLLKTVFTNQLGELCSWTGVPKMAVPTVLLNNGLKCPQLGLGTWQSAPGEVQKAISHAIDVGYRHIDCAWIYGNEKEIGEAIRQKIEDKTVKREDLFIVTKLWNTFHEKDKVVPTCRESLENLGLDYVDLYLVHWPVAQKVKKFDKLVPFVGAEFVDIDYLETWEGMEDCARLGLAKSIGVSNFNTKQLWRVLDHAKIKPVMNQIEVSPNVTQKKLIKFCHDNDVAVTSYSPFGSPARPWAKSEDQVVSLENPKIVSIGAKHGKTSSQVILRYLIQVGTIPIPKSSNLKRIDQNLDIFDFELSPEAIATLDGLNTNGRAISAEELKGSKYFPFYEE